MTTNAVKPIAPLVPRTLTREQLELLKRTVAKGATDDELALFMHIAARTGLDPFTRQIHAVRRWSTSERRDVMTVQTGIDGLRLIAERTGRYAPGREPSWRIDDASGDLESATAYVRKQTADGTWHEVAATAHYAEFRQLTKEGNPTRFWRDMPRLMLAKVAESLALRRAFPLELSGIYAHEELDQATEPTPAQGPADEGAAGESPALSDRLAPLRAVIEQTRVRTAKILAEYAVETLEDLTDAQIADAMGRLQHVASKLPS